MRSADRRLREALGLGTEPRWLEQVHGTTVVDAAGVGQDPTGLAQVHPHTHAPQQLGCGIDVPQSRHVADIQGPVGQHGGHDLAKDRGQGVLGRGVTVPLHPPALASPWLPEVPGDPDRRWRPRPAGTGPAHRPGRGRTAGRSPKCPGVLRLP